MSGELEDPTVELAPEVREWIHESRTLFRYMMEELYPELGSLGRTARREILLLHVRKGEKLLEGETPETMAADALRDAVLWFEERQDELSAADFARLTGNGSPRWFNWAIRLLPASGISRYAKLARRAMEVDSIRVQPGELRRLRVHLEALEGMLGIVDRLSESAADDALEDGSLEGALSGAYAGLERLERRARRDLQLEEAIAAGRLGT